MSMDDEIPLSVLVGLIVLVSPEATVESEDSAF